MGLISRSVEATLEPVATTSKGQAESASTGQAESASTYSTSMSKKDAGQGWVNMLAGAVSGLAAGVFGTLIVLQARRRSTMRQQPLLVSPSGDRILRPRRTRTIIYVDRAVG